jgi:hypothetical protein
MFRCHFNFKANKMFDADSFLSSVVTGANSTKVVPCPVGDFPGLIDKISARQWQSADGTKTGVALDVSWSVEDDGVKATVGRDVVTARQGIMLDLTPDGAIDLGEGKNVALGRLRAAVGLNDPTIEFSFNQLPGRMAKIKVSHRPDKNDPEIVYAQVDAVTALG